MNYLSLKTFSQALQLTNKGDIENAKKHLLKALSINPNYADAHNNLGALLFREKDYTEAKKHYLQAISVNPNGSGARESLSRSENLY